MAITKLAEAASNSYSEDIGPIDTLLVRDRAMRMSDSGLGMVVDDPELVNNRLIHGLTHGTMGAGIGAGIGMSLSHKELPVLGALLGGASGGYAGLLSGAHKANTEYLRKRGVNPTMLGFTSSLTPEAKKKYLTDYLSK